MPVRFRENIKTMTPYKPPLEGRASKGYLLLDFNEMTTEPGQEVKDSLHTFIDSKRLQVYPEYGTINSVVAEYAKCKPEEVLLTNGSDQGIDVVFRAFLNKGDTVIIPSPSFAMFYQTAFLQDAKIVKPRYRENDFSFPFEEVLALLDEKPKLLVLCNPNNPTGTQISPEEVQKLLEKARDNEVAVLCDEAYFEFSGITAREFLSEFDNLFISRTLSKQFGLVSTRIGYLLSQSSNIEQLLKIRGPYDVNMFAKTALEAALQNPGYSKSYIAEVMERSKPMLENFFKERGVKFFPGAANFLLIQPENPQKILQTLEAEGILIRPREDPAGTIRVSIGTLGDTERFIKAYAKAL